MSRDDGFQTADIATSLLEDGKVRKLWRLLDDGPMMSQAVTGYVAVVLASWGDGSRVALDEAAPLWLPLPPEVREALRSAGLLDRTGKVPAKAWDKWFNPAYVRREAKREGGRSRATANLQHSSSTTKAELDPSLRPSVSPLSPSVSLSPRAKENGQKADEEKRRTLERLSDDYKAGRLDELEYQRQRKVLA